LLAQSYVAPFEIWRGSLWKNIENMKVEPTRDYFTVSHYVFMFLLRS